MVTTTAEAVRPAARGPQPEHPGRRPGGRVVPEDTAGGRLHALDGLRFLAAAGVVLYHFAGRRLEVWHADTGELFPGLGSVLVYLRVAPELFFVVSGFAILWTAWGRTVPQVVASRLSRVYPAYWGALALTVLLFAVVWPAGKAIDAGQVAVNATLLQGLVGVDHVDSVYWTLWTELRFYLIMTVFVAVGITRRRVLVFATVWPVVALLAERWAPAFVAELLVSRFAPYFAGGMLLFVVFRYGHRRLPWLLLVGTVALATWSSLPILVRAVRDHTAFEPNAWLVALSVVACFGAVAVSALTPLRRLRWGFLAGLGALTYPVYLVHQMWGRWVIAQLHDRLPPAVTLALAVVLSVALAVVVHHAVEQRWNRPLRRWLEARLERWGRRPARRGAAARAAVGAGAPTQRS